MGKSNVNFETPRLVARRATGYLIPRFKERASRNGKWIIRGVDGESKVNLIYKETCILRKGVVWSEACWRLYISGHDLLINLDSFCKHDDSKECSQDELLLRIAQIILDTGTIMAVTSGDCTVIDTY